MSTDFNQVEHDLALLIGRINIEWNQIQNSVYGIFMHLMKGDEPRAETIFFAIKSDKAQREITEALAKRYLTFVPQVLADLVTMLHALRSLSTDRNDVIHAMWGFKFPGFKPVITGGGSKRLAAQPDTMASLRETHGRLIDIGAKMMIIEGCIERLPRPWPEKFPQPSNQPPAS